MATNLPLALSNLVFCQYSFFSVADVVAPAIAENSGEDGATATDAIFSSVNVSSLLF
jgi:hypothetical protein